ncbi:hypothetical protein B0O99DRAFT_523490 [Bisporella sp. PMI_857]|nr:hypothetical protein B0O99DRAFT_523490 [Bisporella sp. PMI_857]
MKLGKACLQCREGKRRCEKSSTGSACSQCRTRQLHCSSLSHGQTTETKTLRPALDPIDTGQGLPPLDVIEEALNMYFLYIHDKPHSLFHEASLRECVRKRTVSRPVIFGILGLASRFSSDPDILSRAKLYASQAKRLLKDDLENICLENIQACVLIANACGADTEANSESLYFAIANRIAQLLKLSKKDPNDDIITRETKYRVWWTLYLIDRWASAGLGLARQFHSTEPQPPLPLDEYMFQQLRCGDEILDGTSRVPGIWAHMISLVHIFGHIQDFNRQLVEQDEWDGDAIEVAAHELAEQMTAYEQNLPEHIRFSLENLDAQITKGSGRTFIALHLGYHHYATLLYYQYLDRHRPLKPRVRIYAERCKYHAAAFSDLISLSRSHGQAEALYNIVGHMTVVSSSVLLHTLLFGDDHELLPARRRLESNFEALVELRTFWPSVELMTNRLITFQNSCLESVALDTHRVDKWMLKFLLEHALSLDTKAVFNQTVDASPASRLLPSMDIFERSRVTEQIIRDVQAALQ